MKRARRSSTCSHQRERSRPRRQFATKAGALLCCAAASSLLLFDGEQGPSPSSLQQWVRSASLRRKLSSSTTAHTAATHVSSLPPVAPYDRHDVFQTQGNFTEKNALLIFDGETNEIRSYFPGPVDVPRVRIQRKKLCMKLVTALARAMRKHYPDRLQLGMPNFQIMFFSYDNPKTPQCLQNPTSCHANEFAPILSFGSVPKDGNVLPSVTAMPLITFFDCLFSPSTCECLNNVPDNVPGWEDLTPQVVWRGSDYAFLPDYNYENSMAVYGKEALDDFFALDPSQMTRRQVLDALLKDWDKLTPRWRGVARTLEANIDVDAANGQEKEEQRNNGSDQDGRAAPLPWIDVRFHVHPGSETFEKFTRAGDAIFSTEYMDNEELSRYKYHIDIAGGGGTTWKGTLQKLAMPGLLFHHETVMKDFFHDELIPYQHYVPIQQDLSDLRQQYEWAENNPNEAKKIAQAATEFVQNLRSEEWLRSTYERYFVKQVGEIIVAYQPQEHETTQSVIDEYQELNLQMDLVSTCDEVGCRHLVQNKKAVKYEPYFGEEDDLPEWV